VLTMRDLTGGSDPLLTYLQPAPGDPDTQAVRTVETAEVCDAAGTAARPLQRGALAVLPPETCRSGTDAGAVARALVEQGAGMVVLAGPGPEEPDAGTVSALAEAASAAWLPLLAPTRPAPAWQVLAAIQAARHHAAAAHARRITGLLDRVDRLYRKVQRPEELLPYLSQATDAGIYLATPGSTGWNLLADDGCRASLWQARRHGTATALRTTSGQHLLLAPVGDRAPHPLLAGVRDADTGPWPTHLRETLALAGTQAALLRHRVEQHHREETWRRSRRAVRTSIVQALMLGRWELAVRMAAPDTALHLTGHEAVMAVLSCAPAQREELTRLCEDALPHALVVQCPAYPDHVLVAAPAGDGAGRTLATALRGVLAGREHRGAGVSTPQPWARIAHAYAAARQALATATAREVASHSGTDELAAALATVPGAGGWARRVLAMADAGDTDRRWVDLARLALTAGVPGAASLTRTDRSNVRKALVTVMDRLGLDHREIAHRAVAELAFQVAAASEDDGDGHGWAGLQDLLDCAPARAWAVATLGPLQTATAPAGGWLGRNSRPGQRDALDLLVLYLTCGGSLADTAAGLSLSTRATQPRLAALAQALGRPVNDPRGAGPHPALWALLIAGHLPPHLVPDPAGPAPGAPRPFIPRQIATVH
jgi:hypothetical protein